VATGSWFSFADCTIVAITGFPDAALFAGFGLPT
jgi:hypothetical protein